MLSPEGFFFFPSILCEHFLFHFWIKIVIGGYWKGVLIVYRRKHNKGPFSRPIRSLLRPLLVATAGLSMLLGAFYSFVCHRFFNYTKKGENSLRQSRLWCFYLFLWELQWLQTGDAYHFYFAGKSQLNYTASLLQLALNGLLFETKLWVIFVCLSAQSLFLFSLWSFWEESQSATWLCFLWIRSRTGVSWWLQVKGHFLGLTVEWRTVYCILLGEDFVLMQVFNPVCLLPMHWFPLSTNAGKNLTYQLRRRPDYLLSDDPLSCPLFFLSKCFFYFCTAFSTLPGS